MQISECKTSVFAWMSCNLSINSTLHTVFHPEFSILILGYTEMFDCSAEALLSTMWSFSFGFISVCFFPPREREKERVRGPGIPCHNFCANSYMPHVTLLSIQSCISQGFTGAGKWKMAFIHSSRSSMLCLPIALGRANGEKSQPSSSSSSSSQTRCWFSSPLTFIGVFFRRQNVCVEKFVANWFETITVFKCGKYTDLLLPLWASCEAAEVSLWCGGLTGSVFLSRKEIHGSVYTWWLTDGSFFPCLFITKYVCDCVCSWDLIGLHHIYTVRQEGLPNVYISPSWTPVLSCLGRKLEMTITLCAAHPSVVYVFCTMLLCEILMEQSSRYFRLLILIIKLTASSFPFWLEILDTLHVRPFFWGEVE